MTLGTTQAEVIYRGDGATCVFPVPFPYQDKAHLVVSRIGSDGGEGRLAEGPDYKIIQYRDAQRVVKTTEVKLAAPLPDGIEMAVRRIVPLTQEYVFFNQGPNSPKVTEEALDRLTMVAQQLDLRSERLDRRVESLDRGKADAAEFDAVRAGLKSVADAKAERIHSEQHVIGGSDPIAPSGIGAMPAAPADSGKLYVARGSEWVDAGNGGLPAGGAATDLLVNAAPGAGEWRSPASVAAGFPVATAAAAGLMAAADKKKLDAGGVSYPCLSLYFETDGSNTTGDGTQARPFRSLGGLDRLQTLYKGYCPMVRFYFGEGEFDAGGSGRYLCTPYQNFVFGMAELTGKNTEAKPEATVLHNSAEQALYLPANSPMRYVSLNNLSFASSATSSGISTIVENASQAAVLILNGIVAIKNRGGSEKYALDASRNAMVYANGPLLVSGTNLTAVIRIMIYGKFFSSGAFSLNVYDTNLTYSLRAIQGGEFMLSTNMYPTFTNATGPGTLQASAGGKIILSQSAYRDPAKWSPTGAISIDSGQNSYITGK